MQTPEHIIALAHKLALKAGMKCDKRQVKFLVCDHVSFIESLGGTVTWPEPKEGVMATEPTPQKPAPPAPQQPIPKNVPVKPTPPPGRVLREGRDPRVKHSEVAPSQ